MSLALDRIEAEVGPSGYLVGAAEWIKAMYRRHRGASAEIAA